MTTRKRQAARNVQAAAGPARGPVWRALLEAQWRARLQEVTELSLAYHEAAAVIAAPSAGRNGDGQAGYGQAGDGSAGRGRPGANESSADKSGADEPSDRKLRQLLRRAVAARRALADTDEALGRLASGRYGLCEGCAAAIPAWLLTVTPDTRYCPRCRPRPIRAAGAAPALAAPPRWRAAPH